MRLGRAPLAAGLVAVAALAGTLAAAAPSTAAPATPASPATLSGATVRLAASAAPALPAGAARLGAVPAQTTVHLDVALNVRDEAGLDALLHGLADKKSPYFDRFLRPGQFAAMFGPTPAQVAQVTAMLRERGLIPGAVSADGLSIPVTGTAAAVGRAFGISLVGYRLPGGRTAFANSAAPRIPAAVAPLIQGVLGLDTLYTEHSYAVRIPVPAAATAKTGQAQTTPSAAKPCTAAVNQALNDNALTAPQFAGHYGISALYGLGDLGQGVHVAVAELEPNLASDISAYESCYGIHTAVRYFKVDGGAGSGAGSSEAALDIENIAGLAPDATIDVYQAPNTVSDLYQDLNHIVSVDTDRVVSVSWGLCEADVTGAQLQAYQNVMKAANSQAQTVVVAAGDTGSTDCLASDKTKAATLSVSSPASANYVVAVGGTTINGPALLARETVWNGSSRKAAGGAGGGGVSILCMPNYQDYNQVNHAIPVIPGLISARSQKNAACASAANPNGYLRQLPDISADADPYTGYDFLYKGSWAFLWGGTSAATSLVAAEAALVDSSPFCGSRGWQTGPAGLLPEGLYLRAAQDQIVVYLGSRPKILYDVKSGNNDYTPSGLTNGSYPATMGYDLATGLGVPLMTGTGSPPTYFAGVAAEMCYVFGKSSLKSISTTSVSPGAGKAGARTTVTVHGTGFLAIGGTDAAELIAGGRVVGLYLANCTSRTSCRLTLPARPAGTISVEMLAENFLPCLKCRASAPFVYAAAPHISSLSPSRGGGGTRVTIRGRNFYAVRSVRFGGKAGTHLKVVSATEIIVTAPSGSGTVHVTVIAAGGTSNGVKYSF
jgi:subtilase family serine protease